ncbi:hypothetical protein IM511_10435 [Erythrobacteraceae bacterium E2-1 Yellow Sea]|nr:hypothetical protein [Erythrobacteraceae bacterium E2-1 Yellow Sea]
MKLRDSLLVAAAAALVFGCNDASDSGGEQALVAKDMPPLEFEEIGKSESLTGQFNDDWFFAHDINFATLAIGRILVINATGDVLNYRGAIDAAQFSSFAQSAKRKELYVAETYYSRGTRGTRTDMVTIYDRDALKPVA